MNLGVSGFALCVVCFPALCFFSFVLRLLVLFAVCVSGLVVVLYRLVFMLVFPACVCQLLFCFAFAFPREGMWVCMVLFCMVLVFRD